MNIVQTALLCGGAYDLQLQTASATEFLETNGEQLLNWPAGGLPQTSSFFHSHFDFYQTHIFEERYTVFSSFSPYK